MKIFNNWHHAEVMLSYSYVTERRQALVIMKLLQILISTGPRKQLKVTVSYVYPLPDNVDI